MRERSDRQGFGVNLGDVVPGLHALAMPLREPDGCAFAAVSLMGTAMQLPASRVDRIRTELEQVVVELMEKASKFKL